MFYLNVDLKIKSFFPSSTRDWNDLKPEISNHTNIHASIFIAVHILFCVKFFSLRHPSRLPRFEIFNIILPYFTLPFL
jgi:hypothetical protein